jgi:hypothetical protein
VLSCSCASCAASLANPARGEGPTVGHALGARQDAGHASLHLLSVPCRRRHCPGSPVPTELLFCARPKLSKHPWLHPVMCRAASSSSQPRMPLLHAPVRAGSMYHAPSRHQCVRAKAHRYIRPCFDGAASAVLMPWPWWRLELGTTVVLDATSILSGLICHGACVASQDRSIWSLDGS